MIGYYCLTGQGDGLFLIPWVLAGRESRGKMRYYHKPNLLEELTLALKDGRMNRFNLEGKGWEVKEFDIPEIYIKSFIEVCSTAKKKKIEKYAEEIYGAVLGLVEDEEDYYGDFENYDSAD